MAARRKRTSSAGAFAKALEFVIAPAVATPAAAATPVSTAKVEADTPGAVRLIETVSRNDVKKEVKARGGVITPPKPAKAVKPTPSAKVVKPAIDEDDEPVSAKRGFSWPRVRLPSLGFLLVVGAVWWFAVKQRAPRPGDVTRLVNSAQNTAGSLVDGAQSAAQSAAQTAKNAMSSDKNPSAATTPAATKPAGARPPASSPATAAPKSEPVAAPAGNGGAAARRTLDSLSKALDPLTADEADARAAIPVLRALLPRLTSQEDAAWAHIRIAEAHLLMDEVKPACTSLRSARGLAQSMTQADVITNYTTKLSCAQ